MIKKENKKIRKISKVTEYAALNILFIRLTVRLNQRSLPSERTFSIN